MAEPNSDTPPDVDPPASTESADHPSPAQLPPYTRSLLRIKVPVTVTLASQPQPIARIVDMGQGALLQFEKRCEELLELSVAGVTIARGEAVKVGDKFGLRISSVRLPDERFKPVRPAE